MKKFILFVVFSLLLGILSFGQSFYDITHIPEIKIYFKEKDWDAKLDSMKQQGIEKRLVADLVVDGVKYPGAGVRYKGNSSYFNVRKTGSSKLPLNIKVDYTNKDIALPGGITKIKLANVFRDPSFLREVLSYEIAGKYMPAPRANFAKVYVNDQYIGLYNNTESVEEEFLEQYFGDSGGALYKCDPSWKVTIPETCPVGDKASLQYLGEDSTCYMAFYELDNNMGWKDLIYLTKVLSKSPEKIDSIFNVDLTLWMLAYNNVLVNLDSYTGMLCHNYYIYKDLNGIYHPIIWDMNLSFGGFRFLGLSPAPLKNLEMQELSPFEHYKQKNAKRPLITTLLSMDHYRKVYVAHMKTILKENFSNGQYLERAKKIHELIDQDVKSDNNKLYEYSAFQENIKSSAKADKQYIIGIEELMGHRAAYLDSHPLMKQAGPTIKKAEVIDFPKFLIVNTELAGDPEKAYVYYRNQPKGLFTKLELFDDGGHNDQSANDGVWGGTIPESFDQLQYYVVAETATAASLLPERASFEFLEFKKSAVK